MFNDFGVYELTEADLDYVNSKKDEGFSKNYYLLDFIDKEARLKMNPNIQDSSFYAYIGPRRSGKSIGALAQCHRIDPDFSSENICFRWEDLRDLLKTRTKSAVMWDETGVSAYNRDWMSKANKTINKFFQVFGYRQLAVICTYQHAGLIDNQLRLQVDAMFQCLGKDFDDPVRGIYTRKSLFPFAVKKDPFKIPSVSPYKIERPSDLRAKPIGWISLPSMPELCKLCNIKQSTLKDYQKKKQEFFESIDETPDEEERLTEKQVKVLEKQANAFRNLVQHCETKYGYSQRELSKILSIPRSTLQAWEIFLQKSDG